MKTPSFGAFVTYTAYYKRAVRVEENGTTIYRWTACPFTTPRRGLYVGERVVEDVERVPGEAKFITNYHRVALVVPNECSPIIRVPFTAIAEDGE